MVELLPRARKMLAEMIGKRLARSLHLPAQDFSEQRRTGAAARAGPGCRLDRSDGAELLLADGAADDPLGDVLAGADGGGIGQRIDAEQCRSDPGSLRQDEVLG